jgi:hypothetical protein
MKIYLSILTITLLVMQLIRPSKITAKIDETKKLTTSKEVISILKKSCYDCHSYETKWPFYSSIAPISWLVIDHVNVGRDVLNYSKWKSYDKATKIKKLKRTIQTLNSNMMPLPSYLWAHSDAKLDKKNKQILLDWAKKELNNFGVATF